MPNAKCKILVGTVQGNAGANFEHPLNRRGWADAHKSAIGIANASGNWLALVDLKCGDRRLAMYQCSGRKDGRASCVIETPGSLDAPDGPALAGARSRKRRK